MYGLETIKAMNAEAGDKARASGVQPLTLDDLADVDRLFVEHSLSIPALGDSTDDVEAEELEVLFCDTSGWGAPNEPALTLAQFEAKVRALVEEHGPIMLGVGETGQFQAYVHVWRAE